MGLAERLEADMKSAMKERNEAKLLVIRMVRAAIKNKEIEIGEKLSDGEVIRVIRTMMRQGRDSIEAFEKGGRADLADKERKELDLLETYLPPPLSEADIERVVREVVAETGATGPRDMGAVMKETLKRLEGGADGKQVNTVVRRILV